MYRKQVMLILAVAVVFSLGIWTVFAAGLVEERAVLQGEVISLVSPGTHVEEGSELVRVSTLAGSATAARAAVSGVVKEVLVQKGAMVNSGDIVVRIQAD